MNNGKNAQTDSLQRIKIGEGIKLIWGSLLIIGSIILMVIFYPRLMTTKLEESDTDDRHHARYTMLRLASDQYFYLLTDSLSFPVIHLELLPFKHGDRLLLNASLWISNFENGQLALNFPGKIHRVRYLTEEFITGDSLPEIKPVPMPMFHLGDTSQMKHFDLVMYMDSLNSNFTGEIRFFWDCPWLQNSKLHRIMYFPFLRFSERMRIKGFENEIGNLKVGLGRSSDLVLKASNQASRIVESKDSTQQFEEFTIMVVVGKASLKWVLFNPIDDLSSQASLINSSFFISQALSMFVAGTGFLLQGLEFLFAFLWSLRHIFGKSFRKETKPQMEEMAIYQTSMSSSDQKTESGTVSLIDQSNHNPPNQI